jgi:hypothetical protein
MPVLAGAALLVDGMIVVSSVQVVSIGLLELAGATELGGAGADDVPYPVGTTVLELDAASATDEGTGALYPFGAPLDDGV